MAISRAQKKKKKDEAEFDPDFWMVTFGDLLSLMLTFFVLLYSMASLDDKTMQEVYTSFMGGAGAFSLTDRLPLEPPAPKRIVQFRPLELKKLLAFLKHEAGRDTKVGVPANIEGTASALLVAGAGVQRKGPKFVLSFSSASMFKPGSTDISESVKPALIQFANALRFSKSQIIIEGHTDDTPISTKRFPSNWELSATRSASVMKFLVENTTLLPERISIVGYADTRPVVKNLGETYRARNRRVDIVVVQESQP